MNNLCQRVGLTFSSAFLLCVFYLSAWATPDIIQTPKEVLEKLARELHMKTVQSSSDPVDDYEIGLGAMKKIRGVWGLKHSERLSGERLTYTWQVLDGFTSIEVMAELLTSLNIENSAKLLFSCDGRACGHGSQWASKVFGQRILYGAGDAQRYRVYALGEDFSNRLIIYSSARSSDRQYLHIELLRTENISKAEDSLAGGAPEGAVEANEPVLAEGS